MRQINEQPQRLLLSSVSPTSVGSKVCDDRLLARIGINTNLIAEPGMMLVGEVVVRAIRTVMQGDTWFSRTVVDKLARPATGEAAPIENVCLTERELEVLRLLARGYSNQQIAEALSISEGTVKNHVTNVYDKLQVNTRAEAVCWAWQHRLVGEGRSK